MRFPWQPKPALETRDESLSDSFIAALLARAEGKSLAIPGGNGGIGSVYRHGGASVRGGRGWRAAHRCGLPESLPVGNDRPGVDPAW